MLETVNCANVAEITMAEETQMASDSYSAFFAMFSFLF